MNKKYHDKIYTADDINRYFTGQMSPAEQYALERAALDDPFLAEALEGYETTEQSAWQAPLAGLQTAFAEKMATSPTAAAPTTPVVAITRRHNWLRYAAAVLLVGLGTGLFVWLNKGNTPTTTQDIASVTTNKEAVKAQESTARQDSNMGDVNTPQLNGTQTDSLNTDFVSAPEAKIVDFKDNNGIAQAETNGFVRQYDSIQSDMAAAELAKPVAAPATINSEDISKEAVRMDNIAAAPKARQKKEVAANSDFNNFYKQPVLPAIQQNKGYSNNTMPNRSFLAQVVGPDNRPLPFANINIPNEGFGTYSDVKGNVRLVSTDSVLPIEIKSLGFASQRVILRSGHAQKIVLQEDALVYDRVNTQTRKANANAVVSRRAMLQKDSAQNAEPADGWDNYNTYITNNLELPDNIINKNVHGEVEVSFDVSPNGAITNVKVDKSLCNDCDEVAKRMVEQGPQWRVKKGKKTKARVKVQF